MSARCVLCHALAVREPIAGNDLAAAIDDAFPVSPGHALIVSRRHVADLFDLTTRERQALWDLVVPVKAAIDGRHGPQGYNLGVNVGVVAGQTVAHVHLHVIPRYAGDVGEARGGVRWVIPDRADYWSARS